MSTKNLIGGILVGTAIGVAIGILVAPYTGEKTREKLSEGARKLADGLKGSVEDSLDLVKHRFSSGVDELARTGKDIVNITNDRAKI